jgi:hypothetical protein
LFFNTLLDGSCDFHHHHGDIVRGLELLPKLLQLADDGLDHLPGAQAVVAPDDVVEPFFAEHPALRVDRLPDAVRADKNDLPPLHPLFFFLLEDQLFIDPQRGPLAGKFFEGSRVWVEKNSRVVARAHPAQGSLC